MEQYFLAVTANAVDEKIVKQTQTELDLEMIEQDVILLFFGFQDKKTRDLFRNNFKYTSGEITIVSMDATHESCTVHRYGYAASIDEMKEELIPILEETYKSMTRIPLCIKTIHDARKEYEEEITNLNLN